MILKWNCDPDAGHKWLLIIKSLEMNHWVTMVLSIWIVERQVVVKMTLMNEIWFSKIMNMRFIKSLIEFHYDSILLGKNFVMMTTLVGRSLPTLGSKLRFEKFWKWMKVK